MEYDEFGMFADNASEVGLPFRPPTVERISVDVGGGQQLSALRWGGDAAPELVFVHGGAQNAHTWDTVALALDVPSLAVDMPGHGHSDWRDDTDYGPYRNAEAVAIAVEQVAPSARAVIGMSLGGLTTIVLAARRPDLVRKAVIVDVTPGTDREKSKAIADFVNGPEHFDDFDQILKRTMEHNPTRTESSLRRGVLHNARELPDGRWTWRYDRGRVEARAAEFDHSPLWDEVSAMACPTLLLRGTLSPVVGDEDVEEWQRRRPDGQVVLVEDAGHSIQGDKPLELAELIRAFVWA
jgi:pimeloyl-ACP methyl ester carboxylesterase